MGVCSAFVLLQTSVSALTDVKFGPFQLAEFLAMALLPLTLWDMAHWKRIRRVTEGGWRPGIFLLFICLISVGAMVAFSSEKFVVPADANSFAKQPGWISVSRVVQFLLVYSSAFVVVQVCARWQGFCRLALKAYAAAATLSSLHGILSFVALRFVHLELGGAYDTGDGIRLKSFFVEGGPFGLYALSGLVVLFTLLRRGWIGIRVGQCSAAAVVVALLLAQSKSATLAGVITMVAAFTLSNGAMLRRHWKLMVLLLAVVVASAVATGAAGVFGRVSERSELLSDSPELFGDDPNILMGRIAGSVIVPEMIQRHALMGVGIGNYSLLRDSSLYNPLFPAVNAWDLHGLGLYGLTAEIGILGVLALIVLFGCPLLAARGLPDSPDLMALAAFPLVALAFGVQPTFLYPWIVYALAAATIAEAKRDK